MKKFVKGDIDGFLALGLDNIVMFILMSSFCLGFPLFMEPAFFYNQVLPATVIGLVIGNVFYAWQALRLAKRENRTDVCALPYGISVITCVAFTFLVMAPAKSIALASGYTEAEAVRIAWRAGIAASLCNGIIELFGSLIIEPIRRLTPRAALLAAVGGIGLTFVAMDFVFRVYAFPVVGFSTLAIALVFYFGKIRLRMGIPPGLLLVGIGISLSWILHWTTGSTLVPVGSIRPEMLSLKLPAPVIGELIASLPLMLPYLGITVTMGLVNVVLSMQNVESAAASGDRYDSRSSLAFNGLGSIAAAIFGSPYPATIYVGHPGWKAIGSRAGYSTLNAVVMSVIAFTGGLSYIVYVFPIEAGMAIVIWSGVVMCSQAFEATPRRHAPAVVMGLIPAISAYGALLVKRAYASVGVGTPGNPIPDSLIEDFTANTGFYAEGLFALESGYIYTSMFLAAGTVWIIEKRFRSAGLWFSAAAVFSALGLVHGYTIEPANIISTLSPAVQWALGYGLIAAICFAVPILSDYREPARMSAAEREAVDHSETRFTPEAPIRPSASPQGIQKIAPGPQETPDPSASYQ